jgi:glycosyltransferase involved in cell wall biosynthesis
MMSSGPQISVGMPVYNGEKYLGQAIESILVQSFSEFELIISDNASTDRTMEICKAYASNDSRIKYLRHEVNMGGPKNWNFVFIAAKGRYFKWASANDLCSPELLAKCKNILDDNDDVALCYPKTRLIDEQGNVTEDYEDHLDLCNPDPCTRFINLVTNLRLNNPQAGLFRSSVLKRTGLERFYPGGDIPLMAEVALGGKFYEWPEFLFYRRMSPDASTPGNSESEIRVFISPNQKQFYFPLLQRYAGLLKVVFKAPIGINANLRLLFFMSKIVSYNRHRLWAELNRSMKRT